MEIENHWTGDKPKNYSRMHVSSGHSPTPCGIHLVCAPNAVLYWQFCLFSCILFQGISSISFWKWWASNSGEYTRVVSKISFPASKAALNITIDSRRMRKCCVANGEAGQTLRRSLVRWCEVTHHEFLRNINLNASANVGTRGDAGWVDTSCIMRYHSGL